MVKSLGKTLKGKLDNKKAIFLKGELELLIGKKRK